MPIYNNNNNIYEILDRIFQSSSSNRYQSSFDGLSVKDVLVKLFKKLDSIEDDQRAIMRKIDVIEKEISNEDSNRRTEYYNLGREIKDLKESVEFLERNLKIVNENIKVISHK